MQSIRSTRLRQWGVIGCLFLSGFGATLTGCTSKKEAPAELDASKFTPATPAVIKSPGMPPEMRAQVEAGIAAGRAQGGGANHAPAPPAKK